MNNRSATGIFTLLTGLFLLAEGIWGLFSPVVFGVLTTNMLHAVIHILLGVCALYLGYTERAQGFCWFLGGLLLTVGVFRFLPVVGDLVVNLFNVNIEVAWLNIVVGLLALFFAGLSHRQRLLLPDEGRKV
jgi:uncharacterized membrane protein